MNKDDLCHANTEQDEKSVSPSALQTTRERVADALVEAIGLDAYDCTRVWDAWSVGTMSQEDFVEVVADQDRVNEIADAAIAAMQQSTQAGLKSDEVNNLKADLEEAKKLLKPFGSFTGKENYDEDQIDIIGEKGVCGNYCVPDSHGFEVIWADEDNGQTVHFTAGQFRGIRAFLNKDKPND